MLLRKEKLSGYNQRRQMRESAEKNSFDDDISLFDYDDEYEGVKRYGISVRVGGEILSPAVGQVPLGGPGQGRKTD